MVVRLDVSINVKDVEEVNILSISFTCDGELGLAEEVKYSMRRRVKYLEE